MAGNFTAASGDLYRWLGVAPTASTEDLRAFISELEGRPAHWGDEALRKHLQIAYAVLGSDDNRQAYHAAVRLHVAEDGSTVSLPHSWEQLDYLGSFGHWPEEWEMPAPQNQQNTPPFPPDVGYPQWQPDNSHGPRGGQSPAPPTAAQQNASSNLYSMSFPGTYPGQIPGRPHPGAYQNLVSWQGPRNYPAGYPPSRPDAADSGAWRRATLGPRVVAGIIDSMIWSPLFSLVVAWDGTLAGIVIASLLMPIYYIVCEYKFGGTPGKKLMGLAVQDTTTGKPLTLAAATQRNLWRLVTVVPAIGTALSPFLMLLIVGSIAAASSRRGMHDRFANAEVVRKEFFGHPALESSR